LVERRPGRSELYLVARPIRMGRAPTDRWSNPPPQSKVSAKFSPHALTYADARVGAPPPRPLPRDGRCSRVRSRSARSTPTGPLASTARSPQSPGSAPLVGFGSAALCVRPREELLCSSDRSARALRETGLPDEQRELRATRGRTLCGLTEQRAGQWRRQPSPAIVPN